MQPPYTMTFAIIAYTQPAQMFVQARFGILGYL